jgi:hypothetical protein
MRHAAPTFAALALGLAVAAPASAETVNCTPVTSVPVTITTSGPYCLTDDLTFQGQSGAAITIQASRVVLDLDGHTLQGPFSGQAIGVHVSTAAEAIVRNGQVSGFYIGVYSANTALFTTVEDLRIHVLGNAAGVDSRAQGDIIRRNVVRSGSPGIRAMGLEPRILDNEVLLAFGHGIDVSGNGSFIEGNRVTRGGSAAGMAGIRVASSLSSFVVRNRVFGGFSTCYQLASSSAKYRENLATACTVAYSGGSNVGDNY